MSEPPQEPQPLDYSPPDASQAKRIIWQAVGTSILTAIAIIALAFADILGLFIGTNGSDHGGRIAVWMTIALALGVIGVIGFLSRRWYQRPSLRGRAIGLWIGLGIAVLVEGSCFIINR
jgi:hypothetical protein